MASTKRGTPLDKRADLGKILTLAWFYSFCSGMTNVLSLKELAAPVGYTSGHAVMLGASIAAKDGKFKKIFGIAFMYCLGGIIQGLAPGILDGDAVFEGRTSFGMIISSALLLLGAAAKKKRCPTGGSLDHGAFPGRAECCQQRLQRSSDPLDARGGRSDRCIDHPR